jgi:hypothetical protein
LRSLADAGDQCSCSSQANSRPSVFRTAEKNIDDDKIVDRNRHLQRNTLIAELSEQQQRQLIDLTKELMGKAATETRFCEIAPEFANLHLATDGFFAGEKTNLPCRRNCTVPLDTRLILSVAMLH